MTSKFTKTFLFVSAVTAFSWLLAYTSAVLAGDRPFPQATLDKVHRGANQLEKTDQTHRAELSGVQRITIESDSTDVEFQAAEGNEIVARLTGDAPKDLKFELNRTGGAVEVRLKLERRISIQVGSPSQQLKLTIALPKQFTGDLALVSGSGDIAAQHLAATRLSVTAGSGDLTLGEIAVDDLKISTGSGDISIAELSGRTAEVKAGSGDISLRLKNPESWTATARTGSGDITSTLPGTKLSHRDHQLDAGQGESRLKINAGSGDISLSL